MSYANGGYKKFRDSINIVVSLKIFDSVIMLWVRVDYGAVTHLFICWKDLHCGRFVQVKESGQNGR